MQKSTLREHGSEIPPFHVTEIIGASGFSVGDVGMKSAFRKELQATKME